MQKTIRKKVYDTESATPIETFISGAFGDPAGFEERLYRTSDGYFFLHGQGGEESPYPAEVIKPVSAANAEIWKAKHSA